jgi:dTDP-4-amino-4,6-dideoxygalactose transaminase
MQPIYSNAAHPERLVFRSVQRADDGVIRSGDLLYRMGRDAIYQGLKALTVAGDSRRTVLLPSFHCSSQIDAAQAAGLRCDFYTVHKDATIDLEDLRSRLTGDVLAVMIIHYYGWPADLDRLLALTREHDVALFEDCALALLSRSEETLLGSVGDISIFSIRKTLPVEDGGILRLNREGLRVEPPTRKTPSFGQATRTVAKALGAGVVLQAMKRLRGAAQQALVREDPADNSAPDFEVGQADLSMSAFARYVARRIRPDLVVERRRHAYQRLFEKLREHPRFQPLFPTLPHGVCPLSLVIVHPRRDDVEAGLFERGIETYCFGRVPHTSLEIERFPETPVLTDHTLALPCHQDLTDADIQRVAEATRKVL